MTAKATKLRRISEGVCYGCGACPPAPGKLQCGPCLKVQMDRYRSWYGRQRSIEAEERAASAAVVESLRAANAAVEGIDDSGEDEPTALIVAHKEVIKVADEQGRPILAVLPWGAYLKLLAAGREAKNRRGRGKPKPAKFSRSRGQPPIRDSHILRAIIRDHPELSDASIANRFLEKAGHGIHRSTVRRYRGVIETASSTSAPTMEVNGFDLGEYSAMILELAIKAGARPEGAAESEEYADGLVALYEAAEDFDPVESGHFPAFARERIRIAITRGREERKVKLNGSSRRVINFSEIGDEDFDFAATVEDR